MVIKKEKLTRNVFLGTTRLNVKKWTILHENFSTLYSTYFYSQFLIFSALRGLNPRPPQSEFIKQMTYQCVPCFCLKDDLIFHLYLMFMLMNLTWRKCRSGGLKNTLLINICTSNICVYKPWCH